MQMLMVWKINFGRQVGRKFSGNLCGFTKLGILYQRDHHLPLLTWAMALTGVILRNAGFWRNFCLVNDCHFVGLLVLLFDFWIWWTKSVKSVNLVQRGWPKNMVYSPQTNRRGFCIFDLSLPTGGDVAIVFDVWMVILPWVITCGVLDGLFVGDLLVSVPHYLVTIIMEVVVLNFWVFAPLHPNQNKMLSFDCKINVILVMLICHEWICMVFDRFWESFLGFRVPLPVSLGCTYCK